MTVFWLTAAVLIVLAAACVLIPLWLIRPGTDVSRTAVNAGIFRERLAELDEELTGQRITQAQYHELRAELERTLLSDVPQAERKHSQGSLPVILGSAIALLILAFALGYYYHTGYKGETRQWLALQDRYAQMVEYAILQPDTLPDAALADLPAFTRVLQARVLRDGLADPDSLFLLGLSLLQLQVPQEAAAIFRRAYELNDQRSDIMMGYAQALLFAEEGKLNATSRELLQTVLAEEPDHQGARMLLGMGAFNVGDYATAVNAWQPLLAALEPASKAAEMLSERIRQAEQQLQTGAVTPKPAQSAAAERRIIATIDLAPELQQRLTPGDSVFVFARAVNGPPMPLAVVRKTADEWPLRVVLDKRSAMTPALTLDKFSPVKVRARVSKSGDAAARPGDLEGVSQPLDLDAGEVELALTIDRVVGESPAATESATQTGISADEESPAQIAVTVNLAPELANRLQPEDVLFIFAKAATGPPMPLAAVRQAADRFPVQVVLDDSKAVMPSLKLSDFGQVVVSARVSKRGDVTARPGDLEGVSQPLDLATGRQSVSLTVDRIVQ